MTVTNSDGKDGESIESSIQRYLALFAVIRKEQGDKEIVGTTLARMRAMEGGDDEEQAFDDEEQVNDLLRRYGDDYMNDLIVALYYEVAARRAEQLGGEHAARVPGITSVVEQLRRGLNQPVPGREEFEPMASKDVIQKLANEETRGAQ
ncbi:hypothetical protein ACIA5C_47960 [Actinoplanes sp. NPDC051343]|uniref:hypothetical protein n=1 Tax=Actinoplanes sp. NPDC051343 TaxID=3363906 RepID=UPI0037AA7632